MNNCIVNQSFSVNFKYNVIFTHNAFNKDNNNILNIVKNPKSTKKNRIFFIIEENVANQTPSLVDDIKSYCDYYSDIITLTSDPQIIKGGEALKNVDTVLDFCNLFNENSLCRHSYVGIIGGGAFLDVVGFSASIVHRGIRQIRFPTTVLSQNDSGVGVKTAVNMFGKKNFAGTFSPPYAVINDFKFLETLSQRDWVAGIPEAFKVAMIKDADFFHWLCDNGKKLAERDSKSMEYLIAHCAKLHIEHIGSSGDPFEFGSARPLDFGHWVAHKLEMISKKDLRHGEAVAIGLMIDTYYAVQKQLINKDIFIKLKSAFNILNIPLWNDMLLAEKDDKLIIFDGIEEFREHLGGELHITLPNGLGNKIEVNSMNNEYIIKAIEELRT